MERDDRRETSVVAGVAAKAKAQAEALKATPPEPSKPALFDAVRRQGERAAALDVAGIVEGIKAASPKTREQYRRTIKRPRPLAAGLVAVKQAEDEGRDGSGIGGD